MNPIDRQTAIDLLDNLIGMVDDNHDSDYDSALKMGIEALKDAEPNLQQSCNQLATDTISRQAAIDALAKVAREKFNLSDEFNHYLAGLMDGEYAIKLLPSAEPEIIRCKDCKHRYIEDMTWHCPFSLMGGENFFCGYGSLGIVKRRTDE